VKEVVKKKEVLGILLILPGMIFIFLCILAGFWILGHWILLIIDGFNDPITREGYIRGLFFMGLLLGIVIIYTMFRSGWNILLSDEEVK
jgi:hypothetical protein